MELHFTSHSTNLLDFSNPGALLCARGKTKENNNKNPVPVFPSAAKICECWKNADKVQSEGLHAGSFWKLLGMNPRWFSIILILAGKKKKIK